MFNPDIIISCGSGLVGWHQSDNPCFTNLTEILRSSFSRYYVNDLPGVTFDVIEKTFGTNFSDVNTYLNQVHNSELISLVDRLVNNNKQHLHVKELLSNFQVAAGVANFSDLVTQNQRFVGYHFTPRQSNNLRATLTHLGMQIDTIQSGDGVKIYLYETSQDDAIATFDFQNTQGFSLQWRAIENFVINYQSTSGGQAQNYLLGYYEPDTTNPQPVQIEGQPLSMRFNTGCCGGNKKIFERFINAYPIAISNDRLRFVAGTYRLPAVDVEDFCNYKTSHTFGLYVKFNITCDITEVICANIIMFGRALQHAIAVRILWDAIGSTDLSAVGNSVKNLENWKNFALKYQAKLDGYSLENGGWVKGIVDNLTLDFSNIDSVCLKGKHNKIIMGRINR